MRMNAKIRVKNVRTALSLSLCFSRVPLDFHGAPRAINHTLNALVLRREARNIVVVVLRPLRAPRIHTHLHKPPTTQVGGLTLTALRIWSTLFAALTTCRAEEGALTPLPWQHVLHAAPLALEPSEHVHSRTHARTSLRMRVSLFYSTVF